MLASACKWFCIAFHLMRNRRSSAGAAAAAYRAAGGQDSRPLSSFSARQCFGSPHRRVRTSNIRQICKLWSHCGVDDACLLSMLTSFLAAPTNGCARSNSERALQNPVRTSLIYILGCPHWGSLALAALFICFQRACSGASDLFPAVARVLSTPNGFCKSVRQNHRSDKLS